ncbi:DUF1450 domain-containing protein [Aneurinibacillus sp. Ricciae_BoGa-3]|uniref:DUF1450 domain-containing protein n=1 Tax=Aneurinibacillus sp. Ricciae_BoGa-3 TaxID=3022697 RepID=UPI003FA4763B
MAKFCEQNSKLAETARAIDALRREYHDEVEVCIVDCFRRCLACRTQPFCRIQLTTIEAGNGSTLVEKILQTIRHGTSNN